MMSYYNERAEKYDEIYLEKGHANIGPNVQAKRLGVKSLFLTVN